MRFRQSREDQEAVAITRLVDQSASGGEPAESREWAEHPEIRGQVEAERRVARELRDGGPEAPDRLVRAVENKVREAYGPEAGRPRRARTARPARGTRPAIAPGGLAVVIAAIVTAAVGIGGAGARPSIPAAASLAFAPSIDPRRRRGARRCSTPPTAA